MSKNEREEYGTISLQILMEGVASMRPLSVHLNSRPRRADRGSIHRELTISNSIDPETTCNVEESQARYACPHCGSDEVRGDFDTYQVYRAEGDRLIHLRSEWTDPAVLALYCEACGEQIEIDGLDDIKFD